MEKWQGNMHGMEMRKLTYQLPHCPHPHPTKMHPLGGTNLNFKNGAAPNGSRQKKKKGLNTFGKRQQIATVSAARLLFLDTTFLLCPLHLSRVMSFWTREEDRGAMTSPRTSLSSKPHTLSSENSVSGVQREHFGLPSLPHSQLFLSLPVPPSHSFPLPALIPLSPSLSLPLILSATLSVPFSFPSPPHAPTLTPPIPEALVLL